MKLNLTHSFNQIRKHQKYKLLEKMYNERSIRERVIICAGLVVSLYLLWSTFINDAYLVDEQELKTRTQFVQQQMNNLETQIDTVLEIISRNPTAELLTQLNTIKKENQTLDQEIREAVVNMVPPQEMLRVVKEVIDSAEGLTLLNMENLTPEPLILDTATNTVTTPEKTEAPASPASTTTTTTVTVETAKPTELQIFRDGIKIELIGNYLNTVKFLKALEKQKMNLIWQEFEYQVVKYPTAKIRLILHTLSLEKGWIDV